MGQDKENSKPGLVALLVIFALIIGFLLGLLFCGKFYSASQVEENAVVESVVEEATETVALTGPSYPQAIECFDLSDLSEISAWMDTFSSIHSEYDWVAARGYCSLDDGTQLVSFAHFIRKGEFEPVDGGQTLVLFDENSNVLRETEGLFSGVVSDIIPPRIVSVENGTIRIDFGDESYGELFYEAYDIDFDDFSYSKL